VTRWCSGRALDS